MLSSILLIVTNHNLFIVMLNVIMLSVVMLNVVLLSVIMLIVVILDVIMLNVAMLNLIMIKAILLNVGMQDLQANIILDKRSSLFWCRVNGSDNKFDMTWFRSAKRPPGYQRSSALPSSCRRL
jgi:hypothetical protein